MDLAQLQGSGEVFKESYFCPTQKQASPLWRLNASFHPQHSATASFEITIPVALINKLPLNPLLAGIGSFVDMAKTTPLSGREQSFQLTTLQGKAPITFRLNRAGKLTQANIVELGEVACQALCKNFDGEALEPQELYAVHISRSYTSCSQNGSGSMCLELWVPAGAKKSLLANIRMYVERRVQLAGKNHVEFSFNGKALESPGLIGFSCGLSLVEVVAKLNALIASVK